MGKLNILGIHDLVHDPGAAIITRDNRIMAIAEERLNRVKHSDYTFPSQSIAYLFKALDITDEDIDLIVVDRTVKNRVASRVMDNYQGKICDIPVVTINHHVAHAASTFFASGFEDAAIIIVDGAGEWVNYDGCEGVEDLSLYHGSGNDIRLIEKTVHYRDKKHGYCYGMGLGKFYAKMTRYVGFDKKQEGKMMGLASYGNGDLLNQPGFSLKDLIYFDEGKISVNPNIVWPERSLEDDVNYYGFKQVMAKHGKHYLKAVLNRLNYFNVFNRKIKKHKGIGNIAGIAPPVKCKFPDFRFPKTNRLRDECTLPDGYYVEVAHYAQRALEDALAELGKWVQIKTGAKKLCVAGGVGLNIDANSRLVSDCGFEEVFTQPGSSDTGTALGCALWGAHVYEKRDRFYTMRNSYLGKEYCDAEISSILGSAECKKSDNIVIDTAKLIEEGKIIGWFHGGSEHGPRALGHRSILIDPRKAENKDILNLRVKKRESFRPFAPVVLKECCKEYFDIPASSSPFMLLKGWVKDDKRSVIPAVTHVDGSARVQTLTIEDNGRFYEVVKEFGRITGVPVLLNTSFNGPGEPIVESPKDALDCFNRLDLDILILEDYIVYK